MITKEQIESALKEAYEKAGHNAYFGNGFKAGVEFAIQQLKNCNTPAVSERSEQLEAFLSEYLDAVAEGAEGQYYLVKKAKELKASNCR